MFHQFMRDEFMFHMNRHGRIYTGSSDETDEDYSDMMKMTTFITLTTIMIMYTRETMPKAPNSAGTMKINDATRPSLPDERRIKKERKKASHLRR